MPSYSVSDNEFIFEGSTLAVFNFLARSTMTFTIGEGLRLEVLGTSLNIENINGLEGFLMHRSLLLNPAVSLVKLMVPDPVTSGYIAVGDDLEFVGTEDLDYVDPDGNTVEFFQRALYRYSLKNFPVVLRQNGPAIEIYRSEFSNEPNFRQYLETRRKNALPL